MKLAKCGPVPEGCLSIERLDALKKGVKATKKELIHLTKCDVCRYFIVNGNKDCLTTRQQYELSWGRPLSKDEKSHLSVCPACAMDYRELIKCDEEPSLSANVIVHDFTECD